MFDVDGVGHSKIRANVFCIFNLHIVHLLTHMATKVYHVHFQPAHSYPLISHAVSLSSLPSLQREVGACIPGR
jgi:hypothetical protein